MSPGSPARSRGTPFWRAKSLGAFTPAEWEALCDGCGKCCLHKLEDEDTGVIHFTDVACRLLNLGTCRCQDYANRKLEVPECVRLSPKEVLLLQWLPSTCAYRLLAAGKPLAWWHPLVSGDPQSVHRAGISIRGRAVAENRAGPLDHHIVSWPE